MYNTILLPLDGSPFSEKAIPSAVEIAKAFNSDVTLVRVPEPVRNRLNDLEGAIQVYETIRSQRLREASEYLISKQSDLKAQGVRAHLIVPKEGTTPAACLLDLLDSDNYDLVVMSTHGRHGIGKWMMGSVADRLVQHSTTPILLIHPTE